MTGVVQDQPACRTKRFCWGRLMPHKRRPRYADIKRAKEREGRPRVETEDSGIVEVDVPKNDLLVPSSEPMHGREPRRILVDRSKQMNARGRLHRVDTFATKENLLDDATSIIGIELRKYKERSLGTSDPLRAHEARLIQGYTETLVKIIRTEKELEDKDSLAGLSEAELRAIIKEGNQRAGLLPSAGDANALGPGGDDE